MELHAVKAALGLRECMLPHAKELITTSQDSAAQDSPTQLKVDPT